jgi:predicted nucleic acid-binding Zn ribbon protein
MLPQSTPDLLPTSVATPPVVPSCPICETPLQGKQLVCSAKCRIQKSMATRAAKRVKRQADRDATARLHLRAAQQAVWRRSDSSPRPWPCCRSRTICRREKSTDRPPRSHQGG